MTVKFQTGHKQTCGGRDWTRDQSGAISHKAGEKGLLDLSVLSQGQLGESHSCAIRNSDGHICAFPYSQNLLNNSKFTTSAIFIGYNSPLVLIS